MTAISKTFSKDVAVLLDPKSQDLVNITPLLALKCLHQMAQNLPFCKKNSERVASVCKYITEGVLTGQISWTDVSKTLNVVTRFHGSIFSSPGSKDLNLVSIATKQMYSRLLLMHYAPSFRKRFEANPTECYQTYSKIVPLLITSANFDDLYYSFTNKSFGHAYSYSTEELKRTILQCQEWGYREGFEAYQNILIERLDNIAAVLTEYDFAVKNHLSLINDHCQTFFKTHEFYIKEVEDKSAFITYNILSDYPGFRVLFPSDHERRLFCRGGNHYEGNLFPLDLKIEAIEFTIENVNVQVTHKILDWKEFKELENQVKYLKKGRINFDSKTLHVNGNKAISHSMILGLLRMCSFTGINLIRYMDVNVTLLELISKTSPDLTDLRIAQCPLVGYDVKENIPSFFPKLNLFALNGGAMPHHIMRKFLSLPFTTFMLNACVVDWPEDLSGLAHLHTLELLFIKISEDDLRRIMDSINELKSLIMIGINTFNLSILCPHYFNIECLTISASVITLDGLSYLTRFCKLRTITLEGELHPSIQLMFNEFVHIKNLKVKYIGTL